jgi:UDP-3-O-[3-hydroxymyristoyl] glucosamine N-acyltransferase
MQNKKITLKQAAELTQSELIGDPAAKILNVADLESAGESDVSFLANPRYEQAMRRSKAGVVVLDPSVPREVGRNYLLTDNPSLAFQKLINYFYGEKQDYTGFLFIHPTAVIHTSCEIAEGVTIGPHSVIDKNVVIGKGTFVGAGCYIGPHTNIGADCLIHPHVTIREECVIGNRVVLQPGVVIGACGFGYNTDKNGIHTKLNQVGNVIIEDDVEIGANTTIDRARFKSTKIGKGTKIDNLVQIAHLVQLGEHNIIVSQTGIAGSTETGKHVVIAGQVGVAGHLKIAPGTMISARSGVTKSLTKPGGKWGGVPAQPIDEYNRNSVILRNIQNYIEEIRQLKQRLDRLEADQSSL